MAGTRRAHARSSTSRPETTRKTIRHRDARPRSGLRHLSGEARRRRLGRVRRRTERHRSPRRRSAWRSCSPSGRRRRPPLPPTRPISGSSSATAGRSASDERLQGADQLQARLKALRQDVFKPAGKRVGRRGRRDPREASRAGGRQLPAGAPAATRRRSGARPRRKRKAIVVAHYTAYFVDAGVKPHSLAHRQSHRGASGQARPDDLRPEGRKPHPGYAPGPSGRLPPVRRCARNPIGDEGHQGLERGRVMGLQADLRAASVTLLTDYAAAAGVKLQVYPAGRGASTRRPGSSTSSASRSTTSGSPFASGRRWSSGRGHPWHLRLARRRPTRRTPSWTASSTG